MALRRHPDLRRLACRGRAGLRRRAPTTRPGGCPASRRSSALRGAASTCADNPSWRVSRVAPILGTRGLRRRAPTTRPGVSRIAPILGTRGLRRRAPTTRPGGVPRRADPRHEGRIAHAACQSGRNWGAIATAARQPRTKLGRDRTHRARIRTELASHPNCAPIRTECRIGSPDPARARTRAVPTSSRTGAASCIHASTRTETRAGSRTPRANPDGTGPENVRQIA